jgi:UDP-glucose 4-epimerase
MKNIIVVTGGAGFIGSNLIESLVKQFKYKIISIDDYSSGHFKNHIKNSKITYLKGKTKDITKILKNYKKKIHSIFHFGEFSRIFQSFVKFNQCYDSNIKGSSEVFKFALENKIKLIYSATSASLGNYGKDMNLSPYAFTKATNLQLLENLKKWFNFRFEVVYFYNVYGPRHIRVGDMATVVGIFEDHYKKRKSLPVVKPGWQSRKFTHVLDTVKGCIFAWKKNLCKHYIVANSTSYTILQLAKMFGRSTKLFAKRAGERYSSNITEKNLNNKLIRLEANISLKDYIKNFIKTETLKKKINLI